MKRVAMISVLLVAGIVGGTWASAGTGLLEGFRGVVLRVLAGYISLICLCHFVCLLLPKIGLGADIRVEEISESHK